MTNPFSLEGKNIIITGASSGIGRQCAISASEMGATVVLTGRDESRLKSTCNHLAPGNHLYYSLDITDDTKLEPVVKDAVDQIGKISGFIHSAGIEKTLPLSVMKPSIYKEVFAVNVIAGLEFAKIVTKKKYAADKGSLVYIASVMGFCGETGLSAYCCSKGALINGVKALALELASKNIRVNSVSPAHLEDTAMSITKMDSFSEQNKKEKLLLHPLGFGKTIDVANACIYLLSDAARWVTGANLVVDGGYSAR
jgi:NAD(P)-dependent dehydrogenase (short-subunit alcohol dehydrogenase family)